MNLSSIVICDVVINKGLAAELHFGLKFSLISSQFWIFLFGGVISSPTFDLLYILLYPLKVSWLGVIVVPADLLLDLFDDLGLFFGRLGLIVSHKELSEDHNL